jgi:hypothetical protein
MFLFPADVELAEDVRGGRKSWVILKQLFQCGHFGHIESSYALVVRNCATIAQLLFCVLIAYFWIDDIGVAIKCRIASAL